MGKNNRYRRKRVIVFGFEGKNNKTGTNYFSHFKPKDDRYILKPVSCGATDPANMLKSIKSKRMDFDYNSREDLTFLFVDADCDDKKKELIVQLQNKQPKDITIICSNPCFELWFLNHFCRTTKEFKSNNELIDELKKYIPDYNKNKDYYDCLSNKTSTAIKNTNTQNESATSSKTNIVKIISILREDK